MAGVIGTCSHCGDVIWDEQTVNGLCGKCASNPLIDPRPRKPSVLNRSVAGQLIHGLRSLADDLEAGRPVAATVVRITPTPDGKSISRWNISIGGDDE